MVRYFLNRNLFFNWFLCFGELFEIFLMIYVVLKGYLYDSFDCIRFLVVIEWGKYIEKIVFFNFDYLYISLFLFLDIYFYILVLVSSIILLVIDFGFVSFFFCDELLVLVLYFFFCGLRRKGVW